MSEPERATLHFINVDLDVQSPDELRPLLEAMERHAYPLERPPGQASFELVKAAPLADPEAVILEFIRIVKALPPAARKVWDGASKRVFDIGLQSGRHPFQISHDIRAATLRAAADIEAAIAITMYAADPMDEEAS